MKDRSILDYASLFLEGYNFIIFDNFSNITHCNKTRLCILIFLLCMKKDWTMYHWGLLLII